MKTKTYAAVVGMGAALILGLASAPVAAEPAPSAPAARSSVSPAAQDAAGSYWTPGRLRAAKPGDSLLDGKSLADAGGDVAAGEPTNTPGTFGTSLPALRKPQAFAGGYYTGGGKVVHTTGVVFFTLADSNYQCSGSAVVSRNESVVQTAGHCVNEGPGAFATNVVFIPQYEDGAAPYGQFAARELVTTPQWRNGGDLDYDAGFAVVGRVRGTTLTDKVGGQGIAFNQSRGKNMYAFGYPAVEPYDGSRLAWCHGTVADDAQGSADQGMLCNMTGGSSGGPWFLDYNEVTGIGTLNSLNSFKYSARRLSDKMYGPYFGSVIRAVYGTAQGL